MSAIPGQRRNNPALGPAIAGVIVIAGTARELLRSWSNTGKIEALVYAAAQSVCASGQPNTDTVSIYQLGDLTLRFEPIISNGRAQVYRLVVTNHLIAPGKQTPHERIYRYVTYGNGKSSLWPA